MTAAVPSSNRWLFGPAFDLMLGCGLLYALVFATYAAVGTELMASQPGYLLPLLVIVLSMPHYGGTLVRVYEQRQSRRAYAIFSLWASLGVLVWFVAGIYDARLGAIMFTLYLTWSPWHYTGQNYGLAMMFLYRREVEVTPGLKRWIYASFILSYGLAFLTLHGAGYGQGYAGVDATDRVRFLPVGVPEAVSSILAPLVASAYVICLGVMATLLLRRASLRDLVPTAALVFSQALWFSVPMAIRYWRIETGLAPLDGYLLVQSYILMIAIAHAVQYLWVTTYYARASGGWHGYGSYLGKVLLSGIAIWTLPVVLFSPDTLGRLPFTEGLALMVAAAVNIHHFILDGAIWKLRSGPIANVLIRSGSDASATPPRERPWVRRLVWSACAICVAAAFYGYWEEEFGFRSRTREGDLAGASATLDRMAWIGRDNSSARYLLARAFADRNDSDEAMDQYRRVIELSPERSSAYLQLGALLSRAGDRQGALGILDEGLAVHPDDPGLLGGASRASLELGQRDRAIDLLVHAVSSRSQPLDLQLRAQANNLAWKLATDPDAGFRDGAGSVRVAEAILAREANPPDPNVLDTVAAAYASAGRFDDAVDTAARAIAIATGKGDQRTGEGIRERLLLYEAGRPYVSPSG